MIFERLEKWASTDRIAAVDPMGNKLTFAELESRSDAIAADWEVTLPKRANIIIRGDKENDTLCCMFAALKSGHPYSFVPEYFPEKKLKSILAKSGAEVLVSLGGALDFELSQRVIDQDAINAAASSGKRPDPASRHGDNDTAMIFFTSGSTGEPKGVMISMHNLTAFTKWWGDVVDKGIERLRVLNFSSYAFSASLATIYCFMLYLGGTLFAVDREASQSLGRLTRLIYSVEPNYLDCTPSFIDLCMRDETFGSDTLPSMKFISVGGEPLTEAIAQRLITRFHAADIVNGYGTTETTIGTIFCHITQELIDNANGPLPIGYTKEGSYTLVVDENRKPVPDGTPGELIIVSELVSQGYFGDSEKTAGVFFEDENGKRAFC
ncbi:MAG: AMP-binding protein, partial [Oscillospiraceae bacterium]|nr:AMP-binding protein [Oscillospiraceae bacterium]